MTAPTKKESPTHRPLRIFLSHSSADNEVVVRLYDLLEADGFAPWVDIKSIRPGEQLERAITYALNEADVIIFCLSRSLAEGSLFWHEIERALKLRNPKTGTPVLMPVRLEHSHVPPQLAPLFYVDLFVRDGYDRLLRELRRIAAERGIKLRPSRKGGMAENFAQVLTDWSMERAASVSVGGDEGGRRVVSGRETDSAKATVEPPERAHSVTVEKSVDYKTVTVSGVNESVPGESPIPAEGGKGVQADAEAGAVEGGLAGVGAAGDETKDEAKHETEDEAKDEASSLPPPRRVVKAGLADDARERNAINDKPQEDVERDTLGFRDYVFALRDFIASEDTTTPLTISVNGAWGSGKSSLMGMLRRQLEPERPRGLWLLKLNWLLFWARGTLLVLAGRLLIRSGHWDSDYIRLGLDFAPEQRELTEWRFDQLLREHILEAVAARYPHLGMLPPEEAGAYLDRLLEKSRRWARAAWWRRKLTPPGYPTVWFNAWKFGQQEQVWSALAVAVLDQLKTKYNFFTRLVFLARLTLKRADKPRALVRLARKFVVPAALAAAAVLYGQLYETLKPGGGEKFFVLPVGLAWLAPALAAAWRVWREVDNPFHLPTAGLISQPDYEAKVGFIGAFEEDFGRIVEVAVRRSFFWRPRKLVIFIDDLDRCSPTQAASIIEAINLFLDSVGCVFVLGMDVAAVATSIEVKYKELTERMRRDAPEQLSPGSLFLDKIVQVPFNVPRPTRDYIDALVSSITEPQARRRPAPLEVAPPPQLPAVPPPPPPPAHLLGEPGATPDASAPPPPTQPPPPHAYGLDPSRPFDRGSFAREDIKQAVAFASRLLKENPRQVKRFVNLFRLQVYIAAERGLLSEEGEYGLTPRRLAVWVAWYMQWPEIMKLLSGTAYGEELREHLLGISRKLAADDKGEGARWNPKGYDFCLEELKQARALAADSPSHWSRLPWPVWIRDADFLQCLKQLQPYWEDQRLLDSVADMTQFTVEATPPATLRTTPDAVPQTTPAAAEAAPAAAAEVALAADATAPAAPPRAPEPNGAKSARAAEQAAHSPRE